MSEKIWPMYDETKLTPCTHCGMSERNCFSAKKAGCVSCCPKCDHSKIYPTCNRQDWQDCIPQSQPKSEWKPDELPYSVEVDDHSDDCGTVYRLKGPNVVILSKDEDLLWERAGDMNLGFEQGVQRALNGKSDEKWERLKKWLAEEWPKTHYEYSVLERMAELEKKAIH